jgi:sulfur relay (sulfurtransferase) complex TusBCD TusD component (DsrE family)
VFQDNQKYVQRVHTPHYKGRKEEHSNAQQFARELTITEKLLCRIFLKKQEAIEKSTH